MESCALQGSEKETLTPQMTFVNFPGDSPIACSRIKGERLDKTQYRHPAYTLSCQIILQEQIYCCVPIVRLQTQKEAYLGS